MPETEIAEHAEPAEPAEAAPVELTSPAEAVVREHETLELAVAHATLEYEEVAKNRENPHLKSRYANLVAVIGATATPLARHGLVVFGRPGFSAELNEWVLETELRHGRSGERVACILPLKTSPADPQRFGSCLTYMRRYALTALLNISASEGDDDDGHAATEAARSAKAPARRQAEPEAKPAPKVDPKPAAKESGFWIAKGGADLDAGTVTKFVAQWDKALKAAGDNRQGFEKHWKANVGHFEMAIKQAPDALADILVRVKAALGRDPFPAKEASDPA